MTHFSSHIYMQHTHILINGWLSSRRFVLQPFGLCPQRHMLGVKVKERTAEPLLSSAFRGTEKLTRERRIDQRSAAASHINSKRLFPHPLCERLRACVIVESFPCSWGLFNWRPMHATHKIVSPDHLSHPPL
jgi:hypothetical protein